MTPFQIVNIIHKITFQVLDKNARDSGFNDWKDMQEKLNIEKGQAFLIEELIRSAQNKLFSKL